MIVRRLGVGSVAKVLGALHALWGFIFGLVLAVIALAGAGIGRAADDSLPFWVGPLFGAGAVVALPILYGVLGALFGALTAVLYNVVAGMVGGLHLETD
jgi:hypothetical protein